MPQIVNVFLILIFGGGGVTGVISGILLSFGLWGIFKKCGVKPWHALIPCMKYYDMALCAAREPEGRVLFTANALTMLGNISSYFIPESSRLSVLSMAVETIGYIIYLIFLLRVLAALIKTFDVRKRWLILAFPLTGIFTVIFGWNKKYQPKWKVTDYQEQAASLSGANAKVMDKGLTVNIEDRSVTEFFKKKYLLRDIHMYIRPGSMVLLLGGSGAGKTTYLNAVNGYERANAKIVLNNKNVYENYRKMQYDIGFVPQQDLMRGADTVQATLTDAALLRLPMDFPAALRKERVTEVMKIFGLEPVAGSMVSKLSGGQRKRLSIAMEFISNPSLFILDEPDSGLDGVMARELFEQLRKIADQGKIIIVITHTPDRVIDLFDDVIVLAKDANRTGRLAFYGSIDEARTFFGKQRMEEIVMTINRKEEGGEGRADEFIEKYTEVQNA